MSEDLLYALSLYVPWTVAIVGSAEIPDGFGKLVENREKWRNCNHRGPLLIHAAQGFGGLEAFDKACEVILANMPWTEPSATTLRGVAVQESLARPDWRPAPGLVRGAIVGRCIVDGIVEDESTFANYASQVPGGETQRKWWFGGFALVFKNVERLETPIPWKGNRKLFRIPAKVVEGARWLPVGRAA